MGCGMLEQPLSHSEVQETADRVSEQFKKLVTKVIEEIYTKLGDEPAVY